MASILGIENATGQIVLFNLDNVCNITPNDSGGTFLDVETNRSLIQFTIDSVADRGRLISLTLDIMAVGGKIVYKQVAAVWGIYKNNELIVYS